MSKDLFVIKGEVKKVSQKEKTYGIKIGELWINGFNKCPVKEGSIVNVEYEKGEWNGKPTCTIKSIEDLGSEPQKSFVEKPVEALESVESLIASAELLSAEFLKEISGTLDSSDLVSYKIQVKELMFKELMLDRRTKLISFLRK